MKITSKGQVTIPQDIREKLGLLPHCEVEFATAGKSVVIRKARSRTSRGQRLLELMRAARPRQPGMTTDEIMALTRGD